MPNRRPSVFPPGHTPAGAPPPPSTAPIIKEEDVGHAAGEFETPPRNIASNTSASAPLKRYTFLAGFHIHRSAAALTGATAGPPPTHPRPEGQGRPSASLYLELRPPEATAVLVLVLVMRTKSS
jgi:hypothetical protein